MRRATAGRLAGLALGLTGAGLVWFSLRGIRPGEIAGALGAIPAGRAVFLLLLNGLILALFAIRWRLAQRAFGYTVALDRLLAYRLAGFSLNYFTPGPQFGGEPLQVYLLHRRDGLPLTAAAAGVSLDRLVELAANIGFLLIGLAVSADLFPPEVHALARGMSGAILCLVVGAFIFMGRGGQPVSALLEWLGKRLRKPGLNSFTAQVRLAETQVGSLCRERPLSLALLLGVSALTWLLAIGEFLWLFYALGAEIGLQQGIILLTALRLAFLTPVPGGLGVMEAALTAAGTATGLAPAVGLSAALLIRARDLALAAAGLWIGGWFWRSSRK